MCGVSLFELGGATGNGKVLGTNFLKLRAHFAVCSVAGCQSACCSAASGWRLASASSSSCSAEFAGSAARVTMRSQIELRAKADASTLEFDGYASVTESAYEMWDMFGPYTETVALDAFDVEPVVVGSTGQPTMSPWAQEVHRLEAAERLEVEALVAHGEVVERSRSGATVTVACKLGVSEYLNYAEALLREFERSQEIGRAHV